MGTMVSVFDGHSLYGKWCSKKRPRRQQFVVVDKRKQRRRLSTASVHERARLPCRPRQAAGAPLPTTSTLLPADYVVVVVAVARDGWRRRRVSRRRRRRRRLSAAPMSAMTTATAAAIVAGEAGGLSPPLLGGFQFRRHSLRVSASNVAAMVGLHPYKDLVELLARLVYQGSAGQALLHRDAALLGLEVVAEERALLDLAARASEATRRAVEAALRVGAGHAKKEGVVTVEDARRVKDAVVRGARAELAAGKLTPREFERLREGSRSAVDTGYGTCHEDDAIDLYESKCGWEVRNRNDEIRSWPFRIARGTQQDGAVPTVEPMGEARILYRNRSNNTGGDDGGSGGGEDDGGDLGPGSPPKRQKLAGGEDGSGQAAGKGGKQGDNASRSDPGVVIDVDGDFDAAAATSPPEPPPFFCILGSVDGIRDELAPAETRAAIIRDGNDGGGNIDDDDDSSWYLRKVIVECKHRMNRIHAAPPLYEQVQAVTYCYMYDAREADIVQILRRQRPRRDKVRNDGISSSSSVSRSDEGGKEGVVAPPEDERARHNELQKEAKEERNMPENGTLPENKFDEVIEKEPAIPTVANADERKPDGDRMLESKSSRSTSEAAAAADDDDDGPIMTISRVSLDDPVLQHRQNWERIILPRLRSFVEAVYAIRSDDDKRYRLLAATTASTGSNIGDIDLTEEAWQILHNECPWLAGCDTAYYRRDRTTKTHSKKDGDLPGTAQEEEKESNVGA